LWCLFYLEDFFTQISKPLKPLFFLILIFILISCQDADDRKNVIPQPDESGWIERAQFILDTLPDHNLSELKPCDILVKPNLNWLPGTTSVLFGFGFGHAAIVIKGAVSDNETTLLSSAEVFESQARDVPGEYQIRLVHAYFPGDDFSNANYNFKPANLGRYYRLRLDITQPQKDSIINYLLAHDHGLSNTRAWKDFNRGAVNSNGNAGHQSAEYWYCSLIIWQAFYDVLGIDLDANQGLYVYPNDLINSPYFNPSQKNPESRIRF
jgi:hypothetical protein